MILGIDLGTTNSLVGIWEDGKSRLLPNALGRVLTPSAVALAEDGSILVGEAARDRIATKPTLGASSFKRAMGTEKTFQLGRQTLRAEELSALVLKSLKADAEAALGQSVTEAVVTVPAYFNNQQRAATKLAGELAGLKVERLLNEPTAAALAYGMLDPDEAGTIVVVDLGGGTFDVSVLDRFEGVMEVRATAGDVFLGGDDFTAAIANGFLKEAIGAARLKSRPDALALLRHQAEQAKRQLSSEEEATLTVQGGGDPVTWRITRADFERLVEPLLQRIRTPIERALRDAQLRTNAIRHVILAGGASRMPLYRRMIGRLFQRLPIQHLNPDEVVGLGAAVQAGLKSRDAALDEIVLTDVAPFTLGVNVGERDALGNVVETGLMSPVIERNTVIPTSRARRYATLQDRQTTVTLGVYQGEARRVTENLKLGELSVTVPPGPAGRESVEVRFTYDTSGLLEVDAVVASTSQHFHLLIDGHAVDLSDAERQARMAAIAPLKIHPRDQAENQAVLARAERLYQETLGVERERIGMMLSAFTQVMERQDPREIAEHRTQFVAALAGLDRDPFL